MPTSSVRTAIRGARRWPSRRTADGFLIASPGLATDPGRDGCLSESRDSDLRSLQRRFDGLNRSDEVAEIRPAAFNEFQQVFS
jgi:hypothetical protein